MSAAQESGTPAPYTSPDQVPDAQKAEIERLLGLDKFDDYVAETPASATETAPAAPVDPNAPPAPATQTPAVAPAEALDFDALLDDSKPWDQNRVRDAAQKMRAETQRIAADRRKATNMWAEAERKANRFAREKDETLAEKRAVQAERQLYGGLTQAFQSGDDRLILQALSQLTRRDGYEVVAGINRALTTEGKGGPPSREPWRQEIEGLKEYIARQQQTEQQTRETAMLEQAKDQVLTHAQQQSEARAVQLFAQAKPEFARQLLADIKLNEFRRRGSAIDTATAIGILESELKAQFDLSQRAYGQTTGEKGTAGSGPGSGQATAAPNGANPVPAQRPPQSVTTVPAGLGGVATDGRRPMNRAEENEAIAAQLGDEFWRGLGM